MVAVLGSDNQKELQEFLALKHSNSIVLSIYVLILSFVILTNFKSFTEVIVKLSKFDFE